MVVGDPDQVGRVLQSDIDKINQWAQKWLVQFIPSKSRSLVISQKRFKPYHPGRFMLNIEIPSGTSHKLLGFFLSHYGSWDIHVGKSIEKSLEKN